MDGAEVEGLVVAESVPLDSQIPPLFHCLLSVLSTTEHPDGPGSETLTLPPPCLLQGNQEGTGVGHSLALLPPRLPDTRARVAGTGGGILMLP